MELQFGQYRLNRSDRRVLGPTGPIEMSARSFDILAALLARPDEVVSKNDLLDTVWPGLVVEDNTLQVHISGLRKALGEGIIATVHGRGYKYAGPRPVAVTQETDPHGTTGQARDAALPPKPSIAVLAFENLSGDPEQAYFSDGITDDIITELGKFREFLVIARNSSFRFRDKATDKAEVARTLGVQYVVEGSVRKIGNRVRITVQLIDPTSSAHVWGEHYDRDLNDIFAIQDEITEMIAARLARQTRTAMIARGRARPTENMSAYDLYLRSLQMAATYDTVLEAEPLLRQAVQLDPQFSAAHALLSFVVSIGSFWDADTQKTLEPGLEIAKAALRLNPDEAYGHLASGFALLYLRRHRHAEISLNRAAALNPNDPFILTIRALLLNYTGRPEEGLIELDEARRRDPFAVGWYDDFRGILLTTAGRYREAVECYSKLETITSWSLGHMTVCLAELGETEKARATLAKLRAVWPAFGTDEIVEYELCYFEDPAVCTRYRAIFRQLASLP
jgi:TolB-like protein